MGYLDPYFDVLIIEINKKIKCNFIISFPKIVMHLIAKRSTSATSSGLECSLQICEARVRVSTRILTFPTIFKMHFFFIILKYVKILNRWKYFHYHVL